MTSNVENPEVEDNSEVIEDETELAKFIAEQELIRSTAEGLGIEDAEEALRKTAELTAEEMLNVDDSKLTPEQRLMRNEWRDSVIVMVIAEGLKKRYRDMIVGQGNGTVKNNKFNDGYKKALDDIYVSLMNIVPEEYKKISSGVDVYADEEANETTDNSDTETPAGESTEAS